MIQMVTYIQSILNYISYYYRRIQPSELVILISPNRHFQFMISHRKISMKVHQLLIILLQQLTLNYQFFIHYTTTSAPCLTVVNILNMTMLYRHTSLGLMV